MSVSCVGAIAGSDAPAEVTPVMAIVIIEVPGGVTTGRVTGALCAAVPPPPHPVTVPTASATSGTNAPPQTKRGCVPISPQRRKACAATTHSSTLSQEIQERSKTLQSTLSGEPLGDLESPSTGDSGGRDGNLDRHGEFRSSPRAPR